MSLDFSLILTGTIITSSCLLMFIALVVKNAKQKNAATVQITDLELKLGKLQDQIDGLYKKDIEQAGKIAWLESRLRGTTTTSESFEDTLALASTNKLSLTERRHRVLSLVKRGLDVNTISTMLGTPHGEVELIIGLSRSI